MPVYVFVYVHVCMYVCMYVYAYLTNVLIFIFLIFLVNEAKQNLHIYKLETLAPDINSS
jgi:hypothetical protein